VQNEKTICSVFFFISPVFFGTHLVYMFIRKLLLSCTQVKRRVFFLLFLHCSHCVSLRQKHECFFKKQFQKYHVFGLFTLQYFFVRGNVEKVIFRLTLPFGVKVFLHCLFLFKICFFFYFMYKMLYKNKMSH